MVVITDNVVPPAFLSDVLPHLAAEPLPVPLFLDARPELSREEVRLLGCARAMIQPGIESLNDHVLGLMGKGTRVLENLRLLRWCQSYGVTAFWNIIHGIPGRARRGLRRDAEYDPIPPVSAAPPQACQTLSVDRSSPFFEHPAEHGFAELRPLAPYPYLYPIPDVDLWDVAYTFDYACAPGLRLPAVGTRLQAEVDAWKRESGMGELRYGWDADGALAVVDTRPGRPRQKRRLEGSERAVYLACDEICSRRDLERRFLGRAVNEPTSGLELDALLESLVRDRLMVTQGGRYLSLALPDLSGPAPPPRS